MTFKTEFLPQLGRRKHGFNSMFKRLGLRARQYGKVVIVETGCLRLRSGRLDWRGTGCSSIIFESFVEEFSGEFTSIDISRKQCSVARRYCPRANVVCGDSIVTLHKLRKQIARIDLLYLDSLDLDWKAPHASALHHLNELCAASPMLRPGSLVFVDDNQNGIGKGMYIREYMDKIRAKQICDDYQIGYVMQ
jgi:hypothetical protein